MLKGYYPERTRTQAEVSFKKKKRSPKENAYNQKDVTFKLKGLSLAH